MTQIRWIWYQARHDRLITLLGFYGLGVHTSSTVETFEKYLKVVISSNKEQET